MVEFENMEQREVLETPNLEESPNETLDRKLRAYFDGKIVRKDLTKSIKEGANVPVYVLEFLLGQYCSSDDQSVIDEGIHNVKKILADNFVRPDEAQKILSILRERGSYTVIDKLTVKLNIKEDRYEAEFSNLGIKNIPIQPEYASKYDRLLCGGIWCIVQLEYEFVEEDKRVSPIRIYKLTPIQMPHIDMDEVKNGRKAFTKEEWLTIMLRSSGMEPDNFPERVKWLLLARMVPLVENNFNYCELGPRSTGKSHIYKEISPNSILVSGGQTSVANLFYNIGTKTVGLVGMWDCVAFDEIAGINFKDKDGVQIMKDYMASGSFARGKEEKSASASMVFVGNINQDVSVLLKTSHLFEPFPDAMAYDTAFLDRIHCYLPGWEIPKFRPNSFMFFDPDTGDVLICDNDNVSANGIDNSSVYGTPRFMAPEIVMGQAKPSRNTDLYSLAVLLFYMFMMGHPLEGKLEAEIKCMDIHAMNKLYGKNPIFIYDPNDKSNRPVKGYQDNVIIYWELYPQVIRDLFIKSFTVGLTAPNKRVTEKEWLEAFANLLSGIVLCPKCGAEVFFDAQKHDNGIAQTCWNCKSIVPMPATLIVGKSRVLLQKDAKLYAHHIYGNFDMNTVVGSVVQNPKNPNLWGIRNESTENWTYIKPDGMQIPVAIGKSAAIAKDVRIDFGQMTGEFK